MSLDGCFSAKWFARIDDAHVSTYLGIYQQLIIRMRGMSGMSSTPY